MIIHALQTSTPFIYEIFRKGCCIRGNCKSDKYFLFKSNRLQSKHNHMVRRTASVISPFYSLLPGLPIAVWWRTHNLYTMINIKRNTKVPICTVVLLWTTVHQIYKINNRITVPVYNLLSKSIHCLI